MAQDLNGIVISEIFASPTGGSTDTNQDGSFNNQDDFIELYNISSSAVDIGGWTLSDDPTGTRAASITFPANTTIAPGTHITVVGRYDAPLPPGFFSFGTGGFLPNNGDRVILTNGDTENPTSINAYYGDASGGDNFGTSVATESLARDLSNPPTSLDTIASGTPTPECFLTGTRILTASGYKLVEELSIGDKVQTAEGELVDVKWIGYQTIDPTSLAISLRGNPVLVKAGALGNNLPANDLYISPDHSLFIDGLLINAGALVNGVSILQTEPTESFVYHSVELANHALLTVEGTYAESYMPHHEDRANYDNGAEYEQLYPHGSNLMLWPMDYPRISSKTQVPSYVSQKLSNIAQQLEAEVLLSA